MWVLRPDNFDIQMTSGSLRAQLQIGSCCGQYCTDDVCSDLSAQVGAAVCMVIGCSSQLKVTAGIFYFVYVPICRLGFACHQVLGQVVSTVRSGQKYTVIRTPCRTIAAAAMKGVLPGMTTWTVSCPYRPGNLH